MQALVSGTISEHGNGVPSRIPCGLGLLTVRSCADIPCCNHQQLCVLLSGLHRDLMNKKATEAAIRATDQRAKSIGRKLNQMHPGASCSVTHSPLTVCSGADTFMELSSSQQDEALVAAGGIVPSVRCVGERVGHTARVGGHGAHRRLGMFTPAHRQVPPLLPMRAFSEWRDGVGWCKQERPHRRSSTSYRWSKVPQHTAQVCVSLSVRFVLQSGLRR